MSKKTKSIIFLFFVLIISNGALSSAVADDDHKENKWYQKILDHDDENTNIRHRERKQEHHREEYHHKSYLRQINNSTYEEECGACHFVYQPELLPSASWVQILANLDDHFGEMIELDNDSRKIIADYLKSKSAEYSSAKRAVKIMRSLKGKTPLKITDIPYIIEKHHEISLSVLKRESIGSLSNCSACHTTAKDGIYEDDNVVIPK